MYFFTIYCINILIYISDSNKSSTHLIVNGNTKGQYERTNVNDASSKPGRGGTLYDWESTYGLVGFQRRHGYSLCAIS